MSEMPPDLLAPDVSVVIPTHDRRAFLERAVQSCFAGNEDLDVEVVVVDDGSTDDTRDWLRQLDDQRVRPFFQEHQGAQTARNRGMSEARGAFVKFLDDDDTLAEGALTIEVEVLQASEADISYGPLIFVRRDGEKRILPQGKAPDLISGIFEGKIKTYPCVFLYRQRALEGVMWNPVLSYHQDKAFALRVAAQCLPAVRVERTVGVRNVHAEKSISNTAKASASNVERLQRRVRSTCMAVEWLRSQNNLKVHHKRAAASGLWMWSHMLSAYDLDAFDACYAEVQALDPAFEPPRTSALLAALDRAVSPALTERLLYPLRALKRAVS